MLIPQFSLRSLFWATTIVAILCAIIAWGTAGHHWALAIACGLAGLVVLLAVYALLFAVIWGLSLVFSRSQGEGESPFRSSSQS